MSIVQQLKSVDAIITSKSVQFDKLLKIKKDELAKITKSKKAELDPLLKQRQELQDKLYRYMRTNGLDKFQGINIDDISPPNKEEKEKKLTRQEQANRLRQMGIRNPDAALHEIGL